MKGLRDGQGGFGPVHGEEMKARNPGGHELIDEVGDHGLAEGSYRGHVVAVANEPCLIQRGISAPLASEKRANWP